MASLNRGKVFYVMGPSGAGKDSLLAYVRDQISHHAPVIFAHRYITRAANAGGENHQALSDIEFANRQRRRCFAMQWSSHDTCYGIGIEINQWLAMGLNVVINGSRVYFDTALQRYPDLIPVFIKVDSHLLRQRLVKRGRENPNQIEERLQHAVDIENSIKHPRLIKISNNQSLRDAGEQLQRCIQNEVA